MLSMPLRPNEAIARQLDRFAHDPCVAINVPLPYAWLIQLQAGPAAIRLPANGSAKSDAPPSV